MSDAQGLRVEATAEELKVFLDASDRAVVVQHAARGHRPFIHPILAPGSDASVTEDAPSHHPWQHGLYVGFNDVNGIGFWMEGLREGRAHLDGTFHPQSLSVGRLDEDVIDWTVTTDCNGPAGDVMFRETQAWTFERLDDRHVLDVSLSLHAAVPLIFGEYAYGGLFFRMPFRRETGGNAFNSNGQTGAATDAQRANWTAVQMVLPDRPEVTVAVMDHPTNPEHPVPWRVDNELGVGPSVSAAGPWSLDAGTSTTFRHRVAVFLGAAAPSLIEESWHDFSEGAAA